MEPLAYALITIALGTWVGAIIFQSAVVAPAVFVDLDNHAARRFLRTLFPRFYRLGLVCGGLIIGGVAAIAVVTGWSNTPVVIATAAAGMLALEMISLRLVPKINAARDEGESGTARFERLHRISVVLTIVILLAGLALLSMIGASTTMVSGV